jgi:hypothetical protein
MNQFENQLQSWTPRRPSPRIARRLFGAAEKAAARSHRAHAWSLLAPLGACALTVLVAVHSSTSSAPYASRNNTGYSATIALNAGGLSNVATYSLSQVDENLEWNVWPHATRPVTEIPTTETPARLDYGNPSPTNR